MDSYMETPTNHDTLDAQHHFDDPEWFDAQVTGLSDYLPSTSPGEAESEA